MLGKLEVVLKMTEKLDYGISSLMQGVLMEFVDKEYGVKLHESNLKPYAQHVTFVDDKVHWVITTMTEEAKKKIIDPIFNDEVKEINIKHKKIILEIQDKKLNVIEYDELLAKTYFGKCKPYINIRFDTPTAFKVDGKYRFYPTAVHIMKSLIKKHDINENNTELFSDELIQEIEKGVEITKYRLRSTLFHLEGIKIPSFIGEVTVRVRGPQQFINLINMLAEFGEYSGVGIKTAIGMGAITVVKSPGKEK